MEADVLIAGEQIQQRTFDPTQALEVGQPSRINVDAANALPLRLDIAHDGLGFVEAFGAPTEAAAEMKVFKCSLEHGAFSFAGDGELQLPLFAL
jgi:hypothetical protein